MVEKITDWSASVNAVKKRFDRPDARFKSNQAAALVTYMTSRKVVTRDEIESKAQQIVGNEEAWNFINTTIGNVTMALHPAGPVPDPGGWYLWDDRLAVYVVDRHFSHAWKVATS